MNNNENINEKNNSKPPVSKAVALCTVCAVSAFVFAVLPASPVIWLFAALAAALTCTAYVITLSPLVFLTLVIPCAASYAVCESYINVFCAVMPYMLGAAMALCIFKKTGRTATVAICAAITAAYTAMIIYMLLASHYETNSVYEIIEMLKASLKSQIDSILPTLKKISGTNEIDSTAYASSMIDLISLVFPAIIGVSCIIVSYLSTVIASFMFRKYRLYELFYPNGWHLTASGITAIVYVLAYIVYQFSTTAAMYVALNLMLLVLPLMTAMGVRYLRENAMANKIRTGKVFTGASIFFIIVAAVLVLYNFILGFILILMTMGFFGVFYIYRHYVIKKMGENMKNG